MSPQASQLDLQQLAVQRAPVTAPPCKSPRRRWQRYLVPLIILGGFVSLFGWAARDSLLPAQPVTVIPVVSSRAEVQQAGTPLFQAAGWVEPRPTPVVASSLAAGVIDQLFVIEGENVKKGDPIAILIATDVQLALAEAQAQHARQLAELNRAKAALAAAEINLQRPVQLEVALADAEAVLAQTQQELNRLPFTLKQAQTRRELAAENVRRKGMAGDAITGRLLREARAELANAENEIEQLVTREPTLQMQRASLARKRDALAEQLTLLTDQKRAVAEAKANLAVVQSQVEQTRIAVEAARLRLDRMTVRSPMTGCVLRLEARPGQWLSGVGGLSGIGGDSSAGSGNGSSAVVQLYDPQRLQVRVDVRLENVPQVQIGQPVEIETASLAEAMAGEVISVTTQADIQKNTLQVKVGITEPPAVIKPEMLAKVTFFAPATDESEESSQEQPLRLFVPPALIATREGQSGVWVADLTAGQAQYKVVQVGGTTAGGSLMEITQGLAPTAKLIVSGREALSEGGRIRVTREEPL